MKKNKLWKIIWVTCIYAILIIILYLVILYKVKWENKDFNTYLYFYDCGNAVCSTITKPNTYYSKIVCDDGECPYISEFSDNIVILTKNEKSWLYDYKNDNIHNDDYVNYKQLNNDLYVVTDENMKQGIIDKVGKNVAANRYDEIVDYNYGLIVHKENDLYGIDYESGNKVISPKYEDVIIIDNTMYAAKKNNKYQIYKVVNNALKSDVQYDYVWTNHDTIITIKNKQLDILDNTLKSNLLMKITTYLDYDTKSEKNSLNFSSDDEYIYFEVRTNDDSYIKYKYHIVDKKISMIN